MPKKKKVIRSVLKMLVAHSSPLFLLKDFFFEGASPTNMPDYKRKNLRAEEVVAHL